MNKTNILEVKNLTVSFKTDDGTFKAVDDVSFNIKKGEILGLVGESGSGKSVSALSVPRLIPSPPGQIEKGNIYFNGNDLLKFNSRQMQSIRGKSISVIFQEPLSALSPLHKIGEQMVETILLHEKIKYKEAWKVCENWLQKVKIPNAEDKIYAYPFQLSGGMQQRVMIAMALMLGPELVIADEPTTALDVTIQAQIFELIKEIRRQDTAILLITHDMGVIWEMCDRVIVMYASKIVEEGALNDIFSRPLHPYTKGLLDSIPKLLSSENRLKSIQGQVPSPFNYPLGCHFSDRCIYADDKCKIENPPFIEISANHHAACFKI